MPRYPKPSPTTESLSAGVFSALTARAKAHPGPIFPLHVGDTWRDPWEGARAENLTLAEYPLLHTYSPVQGEPRLLDVARRKAEARSGRVLDPETFCVVAGATSGVSVVVQTLLDPGDEVLLPAPFWPLVRGIIASRGAVPVQVPLWDRRSDPSFDVEAALEAAVTPRTVALYLNSPHNPTGGMLTDDEAAAFARVAKRHDLWVISDEVYEDLWFGDRAPPSLWAREDLFDRSIVVHSLSKAYGYAGGRVGYAHGPLEVMKAVRATQTFQVYCAPRPMQLGAAKVLELGDGWLAETRALYRDAAYATARAFGVAPPAGGTFQFVDVSRWLPADAVDATPFLHRCLDECGVLLTPGASSGQDYGRWVRVCFTSVAPEVLHVALGRIAAMLGTASSTPATAS
ncbi:MAG: pyridoxal phosphate-dependent aminotransferase [Deltaproteobacteria bacterium]|nr:pyridoxal phosphate-dependent aminotransferase [Deltaproteobacteria bacterium]